MRNPRPLLCLLLALGACAGSGPSPFDAGRGADPARVYGRGDCLVEVRNLTTRPMELRYYSGMKAPSPTWELWPSLGDVEPRESVRARVPCGDRRVSVRGWHRGRHRQDPPEDRLASAEGWVQRGEVVRLYLRGGTGR